MPENKELKVQLLTNRAAAQFHIGNYRSSLIDCEAALTVISTHMKAVVRAAECCSKLQHFKECLAWCDKGLDIDSTHEQLLKLRSDTVSKDKAKQRDQRKRLAAEKKLKQGQGELLDLIKNRGIKVQSKSSNLTLEDLEPCHPAAMQKRVRLDAGTLVWPVLFLYPEVGETDFIEEFRETDQISDHLAVMFGGDKAPWDPDGRYTPESIVMYYEDVSANLVHVPPDWNLAQVCSSKGFLLKAGTPALILLVRDSKAHKDFLSKYSVVK